MNKIQYLDELEITGKTVLLRVDFNVSLNKEKKISDDLRITQSLPTIKYLLDRKNRLIILTHLGKPKGIGFEEGLSLAPVASDLQSYLPDFSVRLIKDFGEENLSLLTKQTDKEIFLLENIRFFAGEKQNDPVFAQTLAKLGQFFVNDAFAVCHRNDASIVSLPKYLPHCAGLLLKKEITVLDKVLANQTRPVVAIVGGAKVSTKIGFIEKIIDVADKVLVGGGMANTFLKAKGVEIGKSFYEPEELTKALGILQSRQEVLVLPSDFVVGDKDKLNEPAFNTKNVLSDKMILDIGAETQAVFAKCILEAKTIIWNGPMGYIEDKRFQKGTDFIYYLIAENENCLSVVGGGDTLVAISKKEYLDKITHVSTGGGAMLEYIEKGTLPGIEVLK